MRAGKIVISMLACAAVAMPTVFVANTAIAGGPAPLIPRDVLFGNPDKAGLQISPDGKHISFRAAVDGVMNVWVAPTNSPNDAKPVTDDKKRGIRSYFWAETSEHILYIQDKGGDENWHIYSTNLANNKTIDLTPFPKVQARVTQTSPDFPNEILVSINNRNPQLHDVHRVNITTGDSKLVHQNDDGFVGFLTEDDMKIHFGMKMTPDGGSELYRQTGENSWSLFTSVPGDDNLTTGPMGMDKSHKHLFMRDSRGRNTGALTMVNIETGKSKILAEDPQADISGVMRHPTNKNIQAVQSTYERRRWQILDDSIRDDFKALKKVTDGEFFVTSRTNDDSQWTIAYLMDTGPVKYYLYNRKAKKAKFLFTNRKELDDIKLAKMHPVTVKARDGLNLVSYYTLPTWTDADNDGKPNKPMPMVLFVHGGPWARDNWGYNPYHQWLANRGYAVMSVNYRGSTGFGKDFVNAGNFEWAGKMHDDLLDAVSWAVKKGIANKDKVGIMGGSYGGYATLVGLTFTPDTFACGVDIVGPSSIKTLLDAIPPYWKPIISMFTTRVGDHRTEEGKKLLAERSPLTHVAKIKKPLLIGQGANDPRVKQAEADQIVSAMKKNNIPVTYVLFPDEGHGFRRPENSTAFNAVTEGFLAQHLGGRFEPLSDITGSSMTIPEGADQVRGLPKKIIEQTKPTGPA